MKTWKCTKKWNYVSQTQVYSNMCYTESQGGGGLYPTLHSGASIGNSCLTSISCNFSVDDTLELV